MFVCLSMFMGGGKGKKDNYVKWIINFVKKYLNIKYICLLIIIKCRSDDFKNDISFLFVKFFFNNLNFVLYLKML